MILIGKKNSEKRDKMTSRAEHISLCPALQVIAGRRLRVRRFALLRAGLRQKGRVSSFADPALTPQLALLASATYRAIIVRPCRDLDCFRTLRTRFMKSINLEADSRGRLCHTNRAAFQRELPDGKDEFSGSSTPPQSHWLLGSRSE